MSRTPSWDTAGGLGGYTGTASAVEVVPLATATGGAASAVEVVPLATATEGTADSAVEVVSLAIATGGALGGTLPILLHGGFFGNGPIWVKKMWP